jgi:hypothetical protein
MKTNNIYDLSSLSYAQLIFPVLQHHAVSDTEQLMGEQQLPEAHLRAYQTRAIIHLTLLEIGSVAWKIYTVR